MQIDNLEQTKLLKKDACNRTKKVYIINIKITCTKTRMSEI